MTYAVVETDNYGRDYPDEKFLVRRMRNRALADRIATCMNEEFVDGVGTRYWKVVEEPYKLVPGFEP